MLAAATLNAGVFFVLAATLLLATIAGLREPTLRRASERTAPEAGQPVESASRSARPAQVVEGEAPLSSGDAPRRVTSVQQFDAVASIIRRGASNTETLVATQGGVRERLDATEHALRRLVGEMSDVMPALPQITFGRTKISHSA